MRALIVLPWLSQPSWASHGLCAESCQARRVTVPSKRVTRLMGHSSCRDFKLDVTVCLYLFYWYFYIRELSFIVACRGGVEGVRMLNALLHLIECGGEGRVEIFCRHVHRFCPPPGYSNWKLTSLYLYSYREIRRLHKFYVLTFIYLLLFTLLFSQRRRSAEDELMMRHFLAEGDLISVSFWSLPTLFPELRNVVL